MEITKNYRWCFILSLVCLLYIAGTNAAGRSSSPKIVVVDGHMRIQSASNRNISFIVDQKGDVRFGKTSLKTIVKNIEDQGKAIASLQAAGSTACVNNKCSGNGTCVGSATEQAGYVCICKQGYQGELCKEVTSGCWRPCKNGGKCSIINGLHHCLCVGDWYGWHCEHPKPKSCNYVFKNTIGMVSSPGYPLLYPPNSTCTWKLDSLPGNVIEIFISSINIGSTTHCRTSGFLQISDNTGRTFKLCGSSLSQAYTLSNQVNLTFNGGSDLPAGNGFHLIFSHHVNKVCGGHLTAASGRLESPSVDKALCEWVIDNNSGQMLVLKFDTLNIVNKNGSCVNYLEIRTGVIPESRLFRKICQNTVELNFNLPSSTAFIRFRTTTGGNRFHGEYDIACGGIKYLPSGTYVVKSPYYPKAYPNKKTCLWQIKSPADTSLSLRFVSFDVEPHPRCAYDRLAIYDGSSTESPVLTKYCGNKAPLPVMSSDQNIALDFQTDGDGDFKGFMINVNVVYPGCGGVFRGKTGTISSPEAITGEGKTCLYTISSESPDHIIELSFKRLALSNTVNCSHQYVEIYPGQLASNEVGAPPVSRYCGSRIPPVTLTTGRSVTVKFYAQSMNSSNSFYATWQSVIRTAKCDVNMIGATGEIASPEYPSKYTANSLCKYTITVANGHQIELKFKTFAMEHHATCINDYLFIYDGGDANANFLGGFCGTKSPGTILSSSNKLFLVFKTDLAGEDKGFSALYVSGTNLCGGSLHSNTGFITSPNFPQPYSPNLNCVWHITSSEGYYIDLTIQEFQLEIDTTCSIVDYVSIYDGSNVGAPRLATICGNVPMKTPYRSTKNHMMIVFKSNGQKQRKGFKLFYHSDCGDVFTAQKGIITSPNYPQNYPLATECKWKIQGNVNNVIKVNATVFKLQETPTCGDYLAITGGNNNLGKFCGTNGPNISSENVVLILSFKSDSRLAAKGFNLTYSIIGCSEDLFAPNGTFTTPSYPNMYPAISYCQWRIKVAPGKRIQLQFSSIVVGDGCANGSVTVYNGYSLKMPVLGKYCTPSGMVNLLSSSNTMTVLFNSTKANVGFTASYFTLAGGCGGNIISNSGYISSPNYPGVYAADTACTWNIQLSEPGGNIKLVFKDFHVTGGVVNQSCVNDYVKVTDGVTQVTLGKYCGQFNPFPILSTGNKLTVQLYTGAAGSSKGFKAYYEKGCGGTMEIKTLGDLGSFTSPNFPRNYNGGMCLWHLKVPAGYKVHLMFDAMKLEIPNPAGICDGDFIQIRNGKSNSANAIGTYCGTTLPPHITSTGNSLYVFFYANMNNHFQGFKAIYAALFAGCGGNFKQHAGYLASPMYPGKTPSTFQDCKYSIQVALGSVITLSFEHFDLIQSGSCTKTSIKIIEGGITKKKYCGNSVVTDYKSTSNAVTIEFRSKNTESTGFVIYYKTDCSNRLLSDPIGYVTSPNYPIAVYPSNYNCQWVIVAPTGINVKVEFEKFDLQAKQSGVCGDYVAVYDGISLNLIDKYCGNSLPPTSTSKTTTMVLKFVTDKLKNFGGFKLKYSFTIDPSAKCGGTYQANKVKQYISTPMYPALYPPSQTCTYIIKSPFGTRVKLTFIDFQLEAFYCFYDYVNIFDVLNGNEQSFEGEICGVDGLNKTYIATGNELRVLFHSDSEEELQGFKASFERVCGGLLTSTKGKIESPGKSNLQQYHPNENCTWIIKQSAGSVIEIKFNSFSLQASPGCTKDYVLVRNGINPTAVVLGRFCGNNASVVTSSGQSLVIQFVTDATISGAGFEITYEKKVLGCGGTETLMDKSLTYTLKSPQYPKSFPDAIDCEWILKVPTNTVIDISITDFSFNTTLSCVENYLLIRNGPTVTSGVIDVFCARKLPKQIHYKSSVNGMYVRLRGGQKPTGAEAKFKATWKIGCGGWFKATSGVISSPSYPAQYPASSNCTFDIELLEKKQVHLSFTAFSLSTAGMTGTSCANSTDYIKIFNKDHNITTELGTFCGTAIPTPIISLSEKLTVQFISDGSLSGNGFQAKFSTVGTTCGGDMLISGTFETPFYPLSYPLGRICIWVLHATVGISVQLTFKIFDLEPSTNCIGDHVQIRNGRYKDSPLLATYCGNKLPPMVYSSGSYMTVIFKSDRSGSRGMGFQASFKSVQAGCGGELYTASGVIISPGYPIKYKAKTECIWKITVASGNAVKITILDFVLEEKFFGYVCYDYLRIMENNMMKTELCGGRSNNGYTFTSHGSTVTLRFKTDASDNKQGFKLRWDTVAPTCGPVTVIPVKSGVITNPGYPKYKASNWTCTWTWVETEGERITIRVADLDILQSTNCSTDYVLLQNGRFVDSPLLAKLCGNLTNNTERYYHSASHYLRLTFVTGNVPNRVEYRGFKITFVTSSLGCGGLLRGLSGNITTPGYPINYTSNLECDWIIVAPVGNKIYLHIDDLDIEDAHRCRYDKLLIHDGDNYKSPLITQLCGKSHNSVYNSSSNVMFLRFISDAYDNGIGFSAVYNTGCGGILKGISGYALTPNYPKAYPVNQDCRWIISIQLDYHVKITGLDVNLPPRDGKGECHKDYVSVKMGLNDASPPFAIFCGTMENMQVNIPYNKMLLDFISDNVTDAYRGAKVQYATVCGSHMKTNESGVIKFPMHGMFSSNDTCVWLIEFPVGNVITLKTKEFSLEVYQSFHCVYDYLVIRDGKDENAPLFGRFCGKAKPPTFRTSSNFAYIKFISDSSEQRGGFEIQYSKGDIDCGGVFTGPSGTIKSPGYPSVFQANEDCGYKIMVEEGKRVNLTFTKLNLTIPLVLHHNQRDCKNYIKVYDAPYPNDRFRRFKINCGHRTPKPILSLSHYMYIIFHSDATYTGANGDGFIANYTAIPSGCGGYLTVNDTLQTFTSPDYPNNFTTGETCNWMLQATASVYQIQVTFVEIDFPRLANGTCLGDHLIIVDGIAAPKYGLCGKDKQGVTIQSSFHAGYFQLIRKTGGKPFKISYKIIQGCNKTVEEAGGLITSPNYPYPYPHMSNCNQVIQTTPGKRITIFPVDVNIELHGNCMFDYLEFYDGKYINATRIGGRYCGTMKPPTIRSTGSAMLVRFKSDAGKSGIGFAVTYTTSANECGGKIYGKMGSITSPNYPGMYGKSYDCQWDITVSSGKKVNIILSTFELEGPSQGDVACSTVDYLEIFYTMFPVSQGKFCGFTHFAPRTSSDNVVKVKFVSNKVNNNFRGFRLFYKETD